MPAEAPRPAEDAALPLARSGDAAEPADLVDALLAVRAARERLRHVDSLLAALVAAIRAAEEADPQNAQSPANTPTGRAPNQRAYAPLDTNDDDSSNRA